MLQFIWQELKKNNELHKIFYEYYVELKWKHTTTNQQNINRIYWKMKLQINFFSTLSLTDEWMSINHEFFVKKTKTFVKTDHGHNMIYLEPTEGFGIINFVTIDFP